MRYILSSHAILRMNEYIQNVDIQKEINSGILYGGQYNGDKSILMDCGYVAIIGSDNVVITILKKEHAIANIENRKPLKNKFSNLNNKVLKSNEELREGIKEQLKLDGIAFAEEMFSANKSIHSREFNEKVKELIDGGYKKDLRKYFTKSYTEKHCELIRNRNKNENAKN